MKNLLLIAFAISLTSCSAQNLSFRTITEKDGKIGIGTSVPDELLTVKGKIHTQEVIVDLKGAVAPDYVFESYFLGASEMDPTYHLPSLEEVASYIEANHHLKDVPSARVLAADGMELKKMNLILLQKIEELTLYTLQQQKEIDALKAQISKD